jgi:transcriptional regulator, propionate catabolism operon regulatory protein
MNDNKFKIGIIASSSTLINHAQEIAEKMDDDILISLTGLDEAIPVGKEMEKSGAEVIVSRGGTSYLLRDNLHIPVLSIPVTSMNILSSIKNAANLGNRIFIATYKNRIGEMKIFEDLFHIKLLQGVYNDRNSLEDVIFSAKNQGYEIVIGGGISMKLAKKCGLKGVALQTAKETVVSMIEDAKSVAESRKKDQEKTERYRCITDTISEGIVSVDQKGLITTINQTAKEFLGISDVDINGRHITHYIPKSQIVEVLQTQKSIINKIDKFNNRFFVVNYIPIMVSKETAGGICIFKDVSNVLKAENEVRRSFTKGMVAKYYIKDIIYESSIISNLIKKTKKFAMSDATILITGKTGTGKEIMAHSIHNLCRRRKESFVSINCAAMPDQLLESELFGYEEGAFTGSKKGGKQGLFEIAHKGTVFLDEIAATSQNVQLRLLRILQEREIMRIGGDRLIPINVRVIAAANKDLVAETQSGKFREDLFFRLNVLHLHIPSLRERIEDIPVLANKFIQEIAYKHRMKPCTLPASCVKKLMQYSWPGNVRQLKNFIEQFVLLCDLGFKMETFEELYMEMIKYQPTVNKPGKKATYSSLKEQINFQEMDNESEIIRKTMEKTHFCKSKTAKLLGISRTTLWRKLKKVDSN